MTRMAFHPVALLGFAALIATGGILLVGIALWFVGPVILGLLAWFGGRWLVRVLRRPRKPANGMAQYRHVATTLAARKRATLAQTRPEIRPAMAAAYDIMIPAVLAGDRPRWMAAAHEIDRLRAL